MGRLRGVPGLVHPWLALGAAIGFGGCGSAPPSEAELAYASSMGASVEMATNATEEQALERADALPEGEPTQLGDGTVVAGPIYTAASGRQCRALMIGGRQRLACEAFQAEGWVFVPNVFTAETAEPPAEAADEGGAS